MPTRALIALLLAPAAESGSPPAEPAPAIDAWSPPAAEPEPEPAAPEPDPAAPPAPQPMPVPIQPPPPQAAGPQPYDVAAPPAHQPPRPRRRSWPDRPIRWRLDAVGHVGTHTLFDRSWRAFSDDRRAVHLGLSLRGDFRLGDGRVFLGGGATFQRFASNSLLHGSFITTARVQEPLAFLRLSIVTVEGVDVFVQAGGGVSLARLSLDSGQRAERRNIGALVGGLAGLALYLPKKWLPRRGSSRVTGGLELGLGYDWRSKIRVHPTVQTGDAPIDTTAAPLGTLALHGLTWRLGLFVRFQ